MRRGAGSVMIAVMAAWGCAAPAETPVVKAAEPPDTQARGAEARMPQFPTLRNPGFELDDDVGAGRRRTGCPAGWNCSMHSDPNSFRFFADVSDSRRSFCVEPLKKEPWAIATQTSFARSLRGARLRFSIELRLIDVAGAGAGPLAQVRRSGGLGQAHHKLITGSTLWETHAVEFDVPDDAQAVSVGMMLRGTGRACFDNAHVEILRAGKNPV